MPKPLTESQAWAYLAKKWDGAKLATYGGDLYVEIEPSWMECFGLCDCVHVLADHDHTSDETRDAMLATTQALRRGKGWRGKFAWSHTQRGARARAAFCRKMAKKTKRRKG